MIAFTIKDDFFFIFQTFLFSCVPGNHGYVKDILQFYKYIKFAVQGIVYKWHEYCIVKS